MGSITCVNYEAPRYRFNNSTGDDLDQTHEVLETSVGEELACRSGDCMPPAYAKDGALLLVLLIFHMQ